MALQTKKIYYIFQLFPLSRALVILAIYYLIRNLIYSVLLFAIIQYLYYKVIYYCIGYIPLVNIDKIFINYKETEDYMGIVFLKVTKNRQNDLLKFYMENGIKKIPKYNIPANYIRQLNKMKIRIIPRIICNHIFIL